MAKRKQLFHPDDVKKKIQTSQLINRLQDHVFSENPLMDASQVNAAVRLINKVIPDARPEAPGDSDENPFVMKVVSGVPRD